MAPTEIVSFRSGESSGRSGRPERLVWLARAADAALAAFVVSGPNGISQVGSGGALAGNGWRAELTDGCAYSAGTALSPTSLDASTTLLLRRISKINCTRSLSGKVLSKGTETLLLPSRPAIHIG